MNVPYERGRSRSPLIASAAATAYGEPPRLTRHTGAELTALIGLLTGIETVVVGHSRDDESRAAARAFAAGWRRLGKEIITTVDWPETAASWLRHARRLTGPAPDAWVVAAAPLGFAQLSRRLRYSTGWDPRRTFAFASLHDPRLPALAGPETVRGLRGVTADGGSWEARGSHLLPHA
ncbi:hypothetical protein [Actinoallomurus acaciae]|uniref:Substrate-binding family protein n=1 Tax=Actinoallomurus acaciae TaxID=502577 RepID=A0ABV5YKV9_9ACTN